METLNLDTTLGTLTGEVQDGLRIFRGIPYAETLQGLGRVRRPQAVKAWHGAKAALAFGAAAPQASIPMLDAGAIGDDCLNLNIWAPLSTSPLPVMVWIHGGGFIVGSSAQSMYEASRLARDNQVVVVSINYRLGLLGFGCWDDFPALEADTNNGLRDQILALQWVQDHIAAFGGDPTQVTLFGESAGAMSIACLLASPPAKGLFQRAILQSGSADHVMRTDQARRVTQIFANAAGDVSACLGGTLSDIIAAQSACSQATIERGLHAQPVLQSGMTMMPTLGDDILPEHPLLAIQGGASTDVALIVGTNQDEWNLFHHLPQIIGFERVSASDYSQFMPGRGEALFANYRQLMPEASLDAIACAFETDRMFSIPSTRLLEARQNANATSWAYVLDWPSPNMPALKSCHVMDVPFVFGLTQAPAGMFFTGGSQAAAQLSVAVRSVWTSFARGLTPHTPEWPIWPSYNTHERATLRIAAKSEVVLDPNAARRLLWAEQI